MPCEPATLRAVESALDVVDPAGSLVSRAPRYATFAWTALGANLAVILWGAFVRATGSGAGCGSHWPLCNGEVLPRSPSLATLIEFGHRTTSGLALLLVGALVIGAWRRYPAGSLVRRAATTSGALLIVEALIGAGLVLFEYVAKDASIARGFWVSGHLINTFLLVASLTLTAWWASGMAGPGAAGRGVAALALGTALLGVLVLGTSGAVTALGDTLFPATSLAEAKALRLSDTAHVFVRLRIWHPLLASRRVGIALVAAVFAARRARPGVAVRNLGGALWSRSTRRNSSSASRTCGSSRRSRCRSRTCCSRT